LPAGWSIDNSNISGGATSSGCLKNLKVTGKHDVKVTVAFQDGSEVPAFKEDVETGPSAKKTYRKFTTALASCKRINFSYQGQAYNGTVGAMSYPKVGSKSTA
jgi:hypothetical protein